MKGLVVFLVIVSLVVGCGLALQQRVATLIDGCVVLLQSAEEACEKERYELAKACAEDFSKSWSRSEELVALFSKRDNYEEISETAMRLVPLLEEENYSEFRSDCRTTINYLWLLRRYEVLSWQGVLRVAIAF